MPGIATKNVAAGTANALDGDQFQDINSPNGALVSIWASTPTSGATIDYRVGSEVFLQGFAVNVEIAADVVDDDRDNCLMREPVPQGRQFLGINGQITNFRILIEELP